MYSSIDSDIFTLLLSFPYKILAASCARLITILILDEYKVMIADLMCIDVFRVSLKLFSARITIYTAWSLSLWGDASISWENDLIWLARRVWI